MEQKQSEFTRPMDIVPLPSNGVFYSFDPPKTSVSMFFMRAIEEQILLSPQLVQSGKAFDMVIQQCMVDTDIKVDDLMVGDKNKILLFLRINSYGNIYRTSVVSPFTGKVFEQDVDLLKIKDITPDDLNYEQKLTPNKTFKMTTSDKHLIEFKLLNSKEENLVNEMGKIETTKRGGVDMTSLVKLKHQIIALDDNVDKVRIGKYVDNLSPKIRREIVKNIDEVTTGLDLTYTFVCPDTGKSFQGKINVSSDFFYPES